MCIRLGASQTKNGTLASAAAVMKASARPKNSSSTVCMRFVVSGPVSVHCWRPQGPKRESAGDSVVSTSVATQSSTPRGR